MTQDPADAALVEAVLAATPRRRRAATAEVKAVKTASRTAVVLDEEPVDALDAVAALAAEVEDEEDDVDLGAEPGAPALRTWTWTSISTSSSMSRATWRR